MMLTRSGKNRTAALVWPQLEMLEDRCVLSFGTNGIVITDVAATSGEWITSVALQTDDWIVVAGNVGVARYNPNGSLDTTFAGDGKLVYNTPVPDASYHSYRGVSIQGDGKIVATGLAPGTRLPVLADDVFSALGSFGRARTKRQHS